jgi:hypothetical protein
MDAGAFGLDRRAMLQVGVEDDLEVGAQRGQLGTQAGHLVGPLGTQLRTELPPELRFDGQFVFAPRGYLAVELQVVDQFEVSRLGLIHVGLTPIDERHERRSHRGP